MKTIASKIAAVVVCFGVAGCASADRSDGPVAYYPFDGNARDLSGHENHGVVFGAQFETGVIGQSIHVDGKAAYADMGDPGVDTGFDGLDFGTGSFTLACWLRTADRDGGVFLYKRQCSHGGFHHEGYNIDITEAGVLSLTLEDTTSTTAEVTSAANGLNDGEWHHVAAVRDASVSKVRLYIDGEFDRQAPDPAPGNISTSFHFVAGRHPCYDFKSEHCFVGDIDELRLYSRILSDGEIARLAMRPATE